MWATGFPCGSRCSASSGRRASTRRSPPGPPIPEPLILALNGALDLAATLGPVMIGRYDPTTWIDGDQAVRATRTASGPATVHFRIVATDRAEARAYGPGAEAALERAADWIGLADTPPPPDHYPKPLRQIARRRPGIRFARGHGVVDLLVPAVLQQKVSGKEAKRAFGLLMRRVGEAAPGPFPELRLPVSPRQLRDLPPAELPRLGILPRQGATLRQVGERASRLEEAASMNEAEAFRRLTALPGLGPWTASSVMGRGLGFADAVPLGDWNLPSLVAFHLAGEERADDERMLELLEPYRGHRARVLRMLHLTGRYAPRRGPRMPVRPLPTR